MSDKSIKCREVPIRLYPDHTSLGVGILTLWEIEPEGSTVERMICEGKAEFSPVYLRHSDGRMELAGINIVPVSPPRKD